MDLGEIILETILEQFLNKNVTEEMEDTNITDYNQNGFIEKFDSNNTIKDLVGQIDDILEKILDKYITDEEINSYFNVEPEITDDDDKTEGSSGEIDDILTASGDYEDDNLTASSDDNSTFIDLMGRPNQFS